MTYEEAMDRVKLAIDSVRDQKTRQTPFERALLAVLIEFELLRIDGGRP